MNVIQAMKETLDLAKADGQENMESDSRECDYDHLEAMFAQVAVGTFSYGKLCRWLGWMQACVVMHSDSLSLDDMKQINKRNAG